jgi:GNAT superfamily N-acetyltransferase
MKAREATLADKAAIIELWKRCALTRPWNDPSQDFDFAHSGPASAAIVLESDGVIVGAALVGHDGHRGSTYYVGVDPKLQRNGAGGALMAAVEDWLRARGVWKLNLLVHRFLETDHMKAAYPEAETPSAQALRYDSNFGDDGLVRRENNGVVRFYQKLGYGDQDCVALGKRLDDRTDRSAGN